MSKKNSFQIAIDGPVAAGKGTVSRLVAEKLDFLYVDTGAMYRTTALIGIRNNIDLDNEAALLPLVKKANMVLRTPNKAESDGRLVTVLLDGEDVSWAIRTEEAGQGASKVAVHPLIRKELVSKQQKIAANTSVVMEGRDITYRVLPNADLKVFLTGSETVRAKRRHFDLLRKGVDTSFEEVLTELKQRDKRDFNRKVDPLQKVEDAWEIDTTDLSIERVVDLIVSKVKVLQK